MKPKEEGMGGKVREGEGTSLGMCGGSEEEEEEAEVRLSVPIKVTRH